VRPQRHDSEAGITGKFRALLETAQLNTNKLSYPKAHTHARTHEHAHTRTMQRSSLRPPRADQPRPQHFHPVAPVTPDTAAASEKGSPKAWTKAWTTMPARSRRGSVSSGGSLASSVASYLGMEYTSLVSQARPRGTLRPLHQRSPRASPRLHRVKTRAPVMPRPYDGSLVRSSGRARCMIPCPGVRGR
jgi:hypothetical protein